MDRFLYDRNLRHERIKVPEATKQVLIKCLD